MVILGIDAHKHNHTVVAIDDRGRKLAEHTTGTTSEDDLALLEWASKLDSERLWAVEDCRQLSRRLERDLLGAGETIVRVPPKLLAHSRDSARTYGKSDPIDALAVARAALREPDLPTARLDGPSREVQLLITHRDHLVAERTRIINRLRWHLHEIDPSLHVPLRSIWRPKHLHAVTRRLQSEDGLVARLALDLTVRCERLTIDIKAIDAELDALITPLAPTLLAVHGVGTLIAAKLIAETADVRRFKSKDAYARHNGTAPLPVWSGNKTRHRLSRTGNRQLNTCLHRIAITQAKSHDGARALLERRRAGGDSKSESIRVLKRRLSDVVYHALLHDAHAAQMPVVALAA